ncbi:hypothetical protein FRC03_005108 [Tulasnella sp. 419]|nr:hypothetical protein FRC03_005108 [Tulasnella sp. 419]
MSGSSGCPQCGGAIEYVEEALSSMCTQCGIMVNASQFVLADDPTANANGWVPHSSTRVQEKDGKWKNMTQAFQLTKTLTKRLGYPNLSERAETLLRSTVEKGDCKWYARPAAVVGACTFIVLREHNAPLTLEEVALYLSLPPSRISSRLVRILYLHEMKLSPSDPLHQVPVALNVISDIISNKTSSTTPSTLRTYLSSVDLNSTLNLAGSLYHLTRRVHLTHNRSTSQVACALLILAMEGVTERVVPCLPQLVDALAKRFNVSGKVVLERYNEMQTLIAEWKVGLPWLVSDKANPMSSITGKKRQRTLGLREDHASLIKDVIAFQEDLWQKEQASKKVPELGDDLIELDRTAIEQQIDETEDGEMLTQGSEFDGTVVHLDDGERSTGTLSQPQSTLSAVTSCSVSINAESQIGVDDKAEDKRPSKRRRVTTGPGRREGLSSIRRRNPDCLRPLYAQEPTARMRRQEVLDRAASSLLGGPSRVISLTSTAQSMATASSQGLSIFSDPIFSLSRSHMLSHGITPDGSERQLSRLEILSATKGEANVSEEELFVPGELEGLIRDEAEVEVVKKRAEKENWDWYASRRMEESRKKGRRGDAPIVVEKKKTKRVNAAALERALKALGADSTDTEVAKKHDMGTQLLDMATYNEDEIICSPGADNLPIGGDDSLSTPGDQDEEDGDDEDLIHYLTGDEKTPFLELSRDVIRSAVHDFDYYDPFESFCD